MKNSKIILAATILISSMAFVACKKSKVLKNISGEWKVEDVIENGNSIFTTDNVLNKGTITFGSCSSKENKDATCEAAISYDMTILGTDTVLNSMVKYAIVEKGEKILFGDLTMDVVTLEDNKCELTDNENTNKYTYKLVR